MDAELIGEKTFKAELVSEGSWGQRDLGKHESTMRLYLQWGAQRRDNKRNAAQRDGPRCNRELQGAYAS